MNPETIAARASHNVDPTTGAIGAPIQRSTTFERDADGGYSRGNVYSRVGNPNREQLEGVLASLEGGDACAAFSSGSEATAAVFQSLSAGDHVVVTADCYHGTANLLRDVFARWGLDATFVDATDAEQVRQAIKPNTRLVWLETPSNPMLKITDIAATADIAHEAGALRVCDNTWATPILQRPLDLGADLVVHSTTKYLGGHSDVLGGAVVAKNVGQAKDAFDRIRDIQGTYGAVPSAFDCWLVLRGIRTLHLRMQAQCDNAGKIARFLSDHPKVEAVHYPGLASHSGHAIAAGQMKDFGGMLSLQVAGGEKAAMRVAANLKVFTRATSLGGTESLIEHRASIEGPGTSTPDNLLRMSVGIEHADDLLEDLSQALG
ncbi:MAG: cystathionine gamma-synthase [SAR202 cluster bacterium Casp-Chloro-G4]|nr:aminotransferase class V-fold PLP-dependent enzyme [Chloroflexota bacterium]MDA1227172.1 aminotransferase class V-fold PLP-dependent enzyme [Chloroflexota bacterium]PKB61770.1 MAG: cystathionine gamma-synthase [SAR202 cluster bacterium Casp-Chloro-G4]